MKRNYLVHRRWPNGFVCPRCPGRQARLLKTRALYECCNCGRQTSVTTGTVMQNTKLPLGVWFETVRYMVEYNEKNTEANQGITAMELSKYLKLPYKTTWDIKSKLDGVLNRRRLAGRVEIGYDSLHLMGSRRLPRSQRPLVAAALELKSLEIRLAPIPDDSGSSIDAFVRAHVEPGATCLQSDELPPIIWEEEPWSENTPPQRVPSVFSFLMAYRKRAGESTEKYIQRFTKLHNELWRQITFNEVVNLMISGKINED